MYRRQIFIASLLAGVTLGCGGPAKPPAAPRAEAQKAENVQPAAVAPIQAKSEAAGQLEAKSKDLALAKAKELAEMAEAATVNANFKPMPGPALANPEEYALACAVLAAPLDDKPKAAYADWLDRHQDVRGKYLRLWLDMHAGRGGAKWRRGSPRGG